VFVEEGIKRLLVLFAGGLFFLLKFFLVWALLWQCRSFHKFNHFGVYDPQEDFDELLATKEKQTGRIIRINFRRLSKKFI